MVSTDFPTHPIGASEHQMQLRRAPELFFVLDRSEEYAQRINELLRRAKSPT